MYDLIAILIPIVLAVCIVVVIRIIEDSRLKRRFVDAGSDEALVRAILSTDHAVKRRSELKWSSVLISIGAGFALMALLGLDAEDPMSYALLFGTTGIGILIFRWLDPPAS
jgi:hypothetical protein